jgi:putative redox protein
MAIKKIEFQGSQGVSLAARLDMPSEQPRAFAIFAHCFTCSKDILAASRIARALSAKGIAVLRFDFTGLGHSEGEFANTNFSSNIQDLLSAADWLREHHSAPSLLIGHSLGGAAVLAAAGEIDEVVGVATIGAPFDPQHVSHLFEEQREEIEQTGIAKVKLAGRQFTIQRQFLEDLNTHAMADKIGSLRRALLVFHAPLDNVVGVDNAARIYEAAKHPKSFVSLDDADHLLTRSPDAQYVADVLSAWAGRYLPDETRDSSDDVPSDDRVLVSETGDGKFTNRVTVGRHEMLADEPVAVGGDDLGPGPYQYLLAGLGACTTMTLRMYAQRKGIPLEQVKVSLEHSRIHAEDCEDCETKQGHLDRIDKTIELLGEMDDAQRTRLMEIADRCPVHRTLQSEIIIRSKPA